MLTNFVHYFIKPAGDSFFFSIPLTIGGQTREEAVEKLERNCKKRAPQGFVFVAVQEAEQGYELNIGGRKYRKRIIELKDHARGQDFACAASDE